MSKVSSIGLNLVDPLQKSSTAVEASVNTKRAVTSKTINIVEHYGLCPACGNRMEKVTASKIMSLACLTHRIVIPMKDE